MADKGDKKDSLVWKFTKFATRTAVVGGLSFAFGIAVAGLFDYHLWHQIGELHGVVKQTAWIQEAFRTDVMGVSAVDVVLGMGNMMEGLGTWLGFETIPAPPPVEQAVQITERAVPSGPSSDF